MEETKKEFTPRPERTQRGGRRRRKVCSFCVDKVEVIDYKDVAKLRRYMSERGKILPRRIDRHLCKASAPADRGDQARPSRCPAALHCGGNFKLQHVMKSLSFIWTGSFFAARQEVGRG